MVFDHHIPFHDIDVMKRVREFSHDWMPDEWIYGGDTGDWADLTTKFERAHANRGTILLDADMIKAELTLDHEAAPNAEQSILEGNHCVRIETLVKERADALEPLLDTSLAMKALINLPFVNFISGYNAGTSVWERGGLVITHGHLSRKNTGPAMYDKWGSVMFGHTHRAGLFQHTKYKGMGKVQNHAAWNIGCLCNVHGDNVPPNAGKEPVKDWQQGFACIYFGDNGYTVYPISVIDGHFIGVNGKEY